MTGAALGANTTAASPGVSIARERTEALDAAPLWPDPRAGRAPRSTPRLSTRDSRGHPAVNCHDAQRSFVALLDGQLALTERAPVEIHLRQCDRCQDELERLRRRSALLRALWRARLALGATLQDPSLPRLLALAREFLSRCPPRVLPVAAAVTLLVVLVTYGFQRQAELATTPAERPASPSSVVEASSPVPSPEPIAESGPAILPAPPILTSPSPALQSERITTTRPQAKAMARLHDARPRVAADAVAALARRPSAVWIIGRTKDEQIAQESEPVRRDRD